MHLGESILRPAGLKKGLFRKDYIFVLSIVQFMKIRQCTINDIGIIKNIVNNCDGLTLHTHYSYWVVLYNFGNSCFIVEVDNKPVGFVTGLKSTTDQNNYFVWQILLFFSNDQNNISYIFYLVLAPFQNLLFF